MTGATGLVGSQWLERLIASRPGIRVIALTRQHCGALEAPEGVEFRQAEISQPALGIGADRYRELQSQVRQIIHCAADTRFSLPLEEARAANVATTRNVLAFARGCRRLQKIAHVSTVYIAGRSEGAFREEALTPAGFLTTYEQTKHEAERVVLEAMCELPIAIYRLSTIIGDTSGRIRRVNYFHQIIQLACQHRLRMIPGVPDAPVDLIAGDWAAAALTYLFERRFEAGAILHICAGPRRAPKVADIVERTVEVLRACGKAVTTPVLAATAEVEKFAGQLAGREQHIWRILLRYLPHLGLRQAFNNECAAAALTGSGVEWTPIECYYDRIVETAVAGLPSRLPAGAVAAD
ncbi:MAG: SDR family oxidoreductase [Acidobacteria bacterium]|nr:SDR family oxidoreductase [Acidobacteriota bacterium]MBI3279999.1 SDR family oxidoreductase [Acidobacteriota bacterium]